MSISIPLCVLFLQANAQISPDVKFQVDKLITEFMKVNKVPGLGLSIVKNHSEIVYTRGYGFADIEKGIPTDSATIFAIASVSKVTLL